jgi:imidazolonepropionase-like amidohydrolase
LGYYKIPRKVDTACYRLLSFGMAHVLQFLRSKGKLSLIICTLLFGEVQLSYSQQNAPGISATTPTLLSGGIVHIGTGQVYPSGYVLFNKGKIVYAGPNRPELPPQTQTISLSGSHIYPGMILPNTTLGLDEVGAVRATHDYSEVGDLNPNVRALVAYNAASDIIPTLRANGVLTAHIIPVGGYLSGQCSIVQLDAWNWQDASLAPDMGQYLYLPNRFSRSGWWAEPSTAAPKLNEERPAQLEAIRSFFAAAQAYAQTPPTKRIPNLKLAAMTPLIEGRQRLFITASTPRDLVESVLFAESYGISKIVCIVDASSLPLAAFIKEHKLGIILSRVHSLPAESDNPYDDVFRTAAAFRAQGIDFCLDISGDMEVMQGRNLGILAGTLQAYGLTEEQAVEAVTAAPARILGIDKQTGSLTTGLDATLIITDGPLTDARYGKVSQAYIQGRPVSLATHQKALYSRYAKRYGIADTEAAK